MELDEARKVKNDLMVQLGLQNVYFGEFEDREDVAKQFAVELPEDVNILFATYNYGDYCGSAFVLFEQDGKLYEVNGGHCSCYGLEGQWTPEETDWTALKYRLDKGTRFTSLVQDEGQAALNSLILSRFN